MSIMSKLLDFFNMDNWESGKYKTNSSEILSEFEEVEELVSENVIKNTDEKCTSSIPPTIPLPQIINSSVSDVKTATEEKKIISPDEIVPYLSNRMIIQGVHIHFISVARDIVVNNTIDELRIKRLYRINSEDYNLILRQLIEAKVIDEKHNILMSPDTLEHFFDIYQPNLFSCTYSTFDKDIFICLGEILIENGIDYAKTCFLSIDELLDYLTIMEKLKLLEFKKGTYSIKYSIDEFYSICKGVPEYYNNFKIAQSKSNHISDIDYDALDGPAFEQYCVDILLQNNYKNVTLTKASGDHGIDILAEKDDVTYAIQCKCYSSNIGNAAIQQSFTGKKLYRKDIAVVLTNQYFTQQAQDEASELGVKLWDRDKLNEMIKKI